MSIFVRVVAEWSVRRPCVCVNVVGQVQLIDCCCRAGGWVGGWEIDVIVVTGRAAGGWVGTCRDRW